MDVKPKLPTPIAKMAIYSVLQSHFDYDFHTTADKSMLHNIVAG